MEMEKEMFFGVDVSKKTLDVAYFDGIALDWKQGHIKVSNDTAGFKKIGSWIKKMKLKKENILFCMEHTGLYTQSFRMWLEEQGIVYGMADPVKMHHFEPGFSDAGKTLVRVKTDEIDSYRIAMYCEQNSRRIRRSPSKLPSPVYFKLKRLLVERKQYVKQATFYKQTLHDTAEYEPEQTIARKETQLDTLKELIKKTDKDISLLVNEDETIKHNYDLLRSIIGIGPIVALETIILTENFTAITDPRKYACMIAIAPFPKQSGSSIHGGWHVSKAGYTQAKADLSQCVITAIRFAADIKMYWDRKKAEGKPSGVVMNAIKFKLVLRMFAVVKRGRPFVEMDKYKL